MKKNLLLLLVSLYCLNGVAQNKSKEEATELMAEDTCECIAKKKINKSDKKEDKEMALGLCLLESFNEHKSKSKYYRKKTLNDIEQIGEDVGFVMASMCAEDFLSIFSSEELVEIVNDEYDVGLDGSGNAEELTIEVELISMNNDVISYINVKDDYDKSHTFLITEEFEGYDLLKRSNYGKSFTVTFKQVELFDLSEKQYVTKKVITKLEAL